MHADNAATLAFRSLLNCAVREYAENIEWHSNGVLYVNFSEGLGRLAVPVQYRSITGHSLFGEPITFHEQGKARALSPADAISVLVENLEPSQAAREGKTDLLRRAHASRLQIEMALEARENDLVKLIGKTVSFIDGEQGLIAGHGIHPCPKSRDGMSDEQARRFSPEFANGFKLRWFALDRKILHQGHSAGAPSAEEWIASATEGELAQVKAQLPEGDFALLPVHPWQADHMLQEPAVAKLVQSGLLIDCGEAGKPWFATSSVRTLYRDDAPFMPKLSLGVGITNSVRINLARELLRGDDMYRFRKHKIWQDFSATYPGMTFIPDPAYIGVKVDGDVIDGLSVSLRENPFFGADADRNVTLLAALCEHLPGRGSRIGALIRDRAAKEGRGTDLVAKEWFNQFLKVFVRPVFGMYLRFGIAIEAHQQNTLIEIEDGYPIGIFYRDNQGFFHHERAHAALAEQLPGIGEPSESVFGEEPVDERLLYYAFINSVFGIIGAIGREGLIAEDSLIDMMRAEVLRLETVEGANSGLVRKMLAATLHCKANLKTRLAGMDELVGPLETQSVYLEIANPMAVTQRVLADA